MRAWRLHQNAELRLHDVPLPVPGPGQLLVRMRAASLNRGEFLPGHGSTASGPRAVGGECAGDVMAVGDGVQGWRVGERVMGRSSGAFADCSLMDAREAMPVPDALDWTQAGAIPLTFLVVYDMLVTQGRLQRGETLLVAGVTSGVGVAALLAAKAMGARVIGTSGSADKLARLQAAGLDLGLRTRGPAFVDAVLDATDGRGADVAINTVGGSVFAALVSALGFEGRLAMVGYVDGQLRADLDLEALHRQRLQLFGVSNKLRSTAQRAQTVAGFRADWLPLFADGRLKPWVDRSFGFEQLPEALACMERNEHLGKIVLTRSFEDS